jgi:hypothetical protein
LASTNLRQSSDASSKGSSVAPQRDSRLYRYRLLKQSIFAMTSAIKDGIYFRNLFGEIMGPTHVAVNLKDDNQGAIFIALNTVNNSRTKHIDIRHHFIRDVLRNGLYFLSKVHTNYNVADFFTKPLAKPKFVTFAKDLGLKSV